MIESEYDSFWGYHMNEIAGYFHNKLMEDILKSSWS